MWEFVNACTLTFGMKLYTLETLLGLNKDEIYKKLLAYGNTDHSSINYLFSNRDKDQSVALSDFQAFFKSFLWAKVDKDTEKLKKLQRQIYDYDAKVFQDKHMQSPTMTKEDYHTLAKYQVKYAIGSKKLASIFGIFADNYRLKVRDHLSDNPVLLEEYDALTKFLEQRYVSDNFRGNGR